MVEIDITDGMTTYLKGMAATKPDWFRKATKSLGWFMQSEIKKGIRSGAPGGSAYAPIPLELRQKLEPGHKGRFKLLGKLVNAVGYQYQSGNLLVGWLSNSAVRFGTMQELGATKAVTDSMKKWFWAHGVPIKKTAVNIPERQTFGPMQKVLEPKAVPYLEQKILYYWANPPNFASARRRYSVKG